LKADVTDTVNGIGTYAVRLRSGVPGLVDGTDPWKENVLPAFNGASIVAVGTGPGTAMLYDEGLAGRTFESVPGVSYRLGINGFISEADDIRFHQINSDGQDSLAMDGLNEFNRRIATEIMTMNGKAITGPGSNVHDSSWNGAAGKPLVKLWDNSQLEVSNRINDADTAVTIRVTALNIAGAGDCLTPVANVLDAD
jgi:hypothetical protein